MEADLHIVSAISVVYYFNMLVRSFTDGSNHFRVFF